MKKLVAHLWTNMPEISRVVSHVAKQQQTMATTAGSVDKNATAINTYKGLYGVMGAIAGEHQKYDALRAEHKARKARNAPEVAPAPGLVPDSKRPKPNPFKK